MNERDEPPFDDGVLTVWFWHDEPDREAEGMWWLSDLEWPDEEP